VPSRSRFPQRGQVEQALGDDEHRGDIAIARAFFFGQLERMEHAHPVDDAVGELGRDDLAAQPVLVDRLAKRLRIAWEGGAQIAATSSDRRRDRRARSRPAARAWRSTAAPPVRAGSARALLRAAEQFVVRRQPLDRAIEPAGASNDLDHPDIADGTAARRPSP
jgi:hypothetical protein